MTFHPHLQNVVTEFFPGLGKCIYCGDGQSKLGDEHILALSMGGRSILRAASCSTCGGLTSKAERSLAKHSYLAHRTIRGYPTRRPKDRPTAFTVRMQGSDGNIWEEQVPVGRFPDIYPTLTLPPPGMLRGLPPEEGSPEMVVSLVGSQKQIDEVGKWVADSGGESWSVEATISWGDLCRVVAKVAHAHAVAVCGLDAFRPLLPPLILGGYPYLSHLVGGFLGVEQPQKPDGDKPYTVELTLEKSGLVVAKVNLFSLPTYQAVVGVSDDFEAFATNYVARRQLIEAPAATAQRQ